jgi:sugar-specific transcriptional regulator TrmB
MSLFENLKNFGLAPNEIKIYLFLLEHGLATPPQIAKATKIARTNTYNLLQKLKYSDLIREETRKNKKAYLVTNPSALVKTLEKKKELLDSFLPDIEGLFNKSSNKPIIKFYEGLEEIKKIYEATLKTDELYAIGSTRKLMDLDENFFVNYERQVKKNSIIVHEIINYASKEKGFPQSKSILQNLLDTTILPKKYADFSSDILLWENNIAIINLDEPIFGTILTHPALVKTFKVLFSVISD